MKVLFLDIDGVVNCHRTPNSDGWPIDPYMALLVDRIVHATKCVVVLSSSWRHSPEGIDIVNKKVTKLFGTTTKNAESGGVMRYGTISRGTEIEMWLKDWYEGTFEFLQSSDRGIPPILNDSIERYAIIDDNGDMLFSQKPNFFQTSFYIGLTQEIADAVIKHLNS